MGQVFDHFVYGLGDHVAAADTGQVALYQVVSLSLKIGKDLGAENAAGSGGVVAVQDADFFDIGAKFTELVARETGETA